MKACVGAVMLAAAAGAEAHAPDVRQAKVDAVFASYAKPDVPGCAVGISEAGRLVYAKGNGLADLACVHALQPTTADRFLLRANAALTFERGSGGQVVRLVVATPRAHRVVYDRGR